jgi:O-antigen/teichoic acid export membrane protein
LLLVLSRIRQLVSQTAIYGLSSIVGRLLNYLLVPLYTYLFTTEQYGVVSEFYAYAGFFAVVLIWGLETGYFRFRQQSGFEDHLSVYSNALSWLFLSNALLVLLVSLFAQPMADWLLYPDHPEYVRYFAWILALDAFSALPFARLRAEKRAWRFAGIKIGEITLTIVLNLWFLVACPKWWPQFYQPEMGVAYIFEANLIASAFKMLLLLPQIRRVPFRLQRSIIQPLAAYSLPMVVIGLAGMVNEMLSRAILKVTLPYDTVTNLKQLGIFGACYKLSVLMTLFVQAFRYASEPFFFAQAKREDARRTYALVMRYFVIAGMAIFLFVMLLLPIFQYFIGKEFREGLAVVPILLMANLLLGIYVNLSIWYKLSDRTGLGAWVSLAGAAITIALNWLWIPWLGYVGSAWATLACYAFMVLASWGLGQVFYPVRYPLAALFFYVGFGLGLYCAHQYWLALYPEWQWWSASLCGLVYALAVWLLEIRAGSAVRVQA